MQRSSRRIARPLRLASLLALVLLLAACVQTPDPNAGAPQGDEYLAGPAGEPVELSYTFPGDAAPTTIEAELYDGVVLIEGDIALGTYEELTTGSIELSPHSHGNPTNYWPASTTTAPYVYEIPYEISDDFSQNYIDNTIEPAIEHWNLNTNIEFVVRNGEADYVEFVTANNRCWSAVGRRTGRQEIRLDESGCTRVATVIHELGHTVGLKHEQQRPDRDEYVEIVTENIQTNPDRSGNFALFGTGLPLGEYGYTSIMHYRRTAFGMLDADGNRLTTIRTLGDPISPASILTDGDLAGVRRLYPDQDLPFVSITDPETTVTVEEGDTVTFAADAVIDPTVDDRDLVLSWTYDRNGVPFTFATRPHTEAVTHRFCDGAHDVTVSAILPSQGTLATDTVRVNVTDLGMTNPPDLCAISVSIDEPLEGAVFLEGATVFLSATIDDDHPETDDPLYPVIWRRNDPDNGIIISTGLQGSTKLGAGQHTIYVTYGSATDSVTVTVEDAGTPPTASVTSPADGAVLSWESYFNGSQSLLIPVTGSGSDAEDGTLSGSDLSWSWRIAGATSWNANVATGASATLQIPVRTGNTSYDIRLVATDSNGFTDVDIITITVIGPPS